jgi:hypothetical protein
MGRLHLVGKEPPYTVLKMERACNIIQLGDLSMTSLALSMSHTNNKSKQERHTAWVYMNRTDVYWIFLQTPSTQRSSSWQSVLVLQRGTHFPPGPQICFPGQSALI